MAATSKPRVRNYVGKDTIAVSGRPGMAIRMGNAVVGTVINGAVGGSKNSVHMQLYLMMREAAAKKSGLTLEAFDRAMFAYYSIAQDMLLSGKPIGIPFVGVLHLRKVFSVERYNATRGNTGIRYKPTIKVPASMQRFLDDNATYHGMWKSVFADLRYAWALENGKPPGRAYYAAKRQEKERHDKELAHEKYLQEAAAWAASRGPKCGYADFGEWCTARRQSAFARRRSAAAGSGRI